MSGYYRKYDSHGADGMHLRKFMILFPDYEDKIVSYDDIGDMDVCFGISDGGKVIFDTLNETARYISPRPVAVTELPQEEWLYEFSRKLKRKLSMINMTQKELSSNTRIPINTLGRYTRGERVPDIITTKKIAKALGCDVMELIDFDYLI